MRLPEKAPKIDTAKLAEFPPELIVDSNFQKFLIRCNQEYVHWAVLKRKKIPQEIKPDVVWTILKIIRRSQYRSLNFGKWAFNYFLSDQSLRQLHFLDKGAAGHLQAGSTTMNVEGKERYIISSLMEEAIASSQLEGAATTRKVGKKLLKLGKKPKSYSDRMIINGYKTMQKIITMKDKKITAEQILQLQKEITEGTLKDEEDSGKFRDTNGVIVGDVTYADNIYHHPPNFKEIPKLMEDFCNFASEDTDEFIHPIIKGIILHFLIGYIHPFNDGNGRTARTIFYWHVLSRGYWLFEFMAVSRILLRSKKKYDLAYLYTETDENDLTYFINYNLKSIEEALNAMEKYISRKQNEQSDALKLVEEIKSINLRQADILREFLLHPHKSFTIHEIMSQYGVVYQTARTDLIELEKLEIISKVRVKKKYVYKLSELT
ncbi:MAG: Fic family protein [Candidatus Nanoarchaeia archaeon]